MRSVIPLILSAAAVSSALSIPHPHNNAKRDDVPQSLKDLKLKDVHCTRGTGEECYTSDYTSKASGVAEVYCYSQDPFWDASGKNSYCDVKSCKEGWIKYKNSYCVSSDYRTVNFCPEGYKYAPVGCVCISSGEEEVPCPP